MGYLKRLPIRVQLSGLALIIIVIVIFIIFTNYFKAAKDVEKRNSEYLTEIISQTNQTISSNNDVLKRLVQNIAYNSPIVQKYLNETDPADKFIIYSQLKSYISDMIGMKDGILDIALISNDGVSFNTNGFIGNLLPFMDEIPKKQLYYVSETTILPFDNVERNVFIAGARIYSITNFEIPEDIGTLMIVIDANALLGNPDKVMRPSGSNTYMTDRKGKVFFTNDDSVDLGSDYSDMISSDMETEYIVHKGAILEIDGEIIIKMPQSELLRGIEDIRMQTFIIFTISLLFLAVPFLLVINNILQPLKILMRFMNEFKLGKLKTLKKRISLQGYAEITIMANDFNVMLDEIDDLTHRLLESNKRLYEAELVKKQSELAYLQSQINPHFLYNTLESIKGMAAEEGDSNIFNMTKSLALVFRYSIKGADIVSLREELNIIKSYIYIQKIRFGKRLEVEYHFPEKILELKVPKMILQPIVENAIFHGIEPKVGQGLLQIKGHVSEDKLYLSIKDDGVGMRDETLHAIMLSKNDDRTANIGLANVNDRIKLNYGNEYGITINSEPGTGTEVVIIMPLRSESDV